MKSSARISEKSIFENVRSFDGGRERKAFFRELNFEHKKKEKRTTFVHQNAKFRKSQGNEKGKKKTNLGFDDCSKRETKICLFGWILKRRELAVQACFN